MDIEMSKPCYKLGSASAWTQGLRHHSWKIRDWRAEEKVEIETKSRFHVEVERFLRFQNQMSVVCESIKEEDDKEERDHDAHHGF
ncbi:hypothetical protein ACFX14_037742 [Malus domestica]